MAFNPPGIEFYDINSGRTMTYVYPDTKHWSAGWILFKNHDGQWVTLRKATDADIATINKSVVAAHHQPEAPNA
jgi:hypothetical protein